VAFADPDVYVEFHSPDELDSDAFWKHFHRKSGGKHVLEFGGSHRKTMGVAHDKSHDHQLADKHNEIQHKMQQKLAANLGEQERERRMSEHDAAMLENEAQRALNRKSALQSMAKEQSDQIRERGKSLIRTEEAANTNAFLKKELLSTENLEKMEERERKANRRSATAQVTEVRREIMEELEAQDQNAENVIRYARKKSIELQTGEQERRVSNHQTNEEVGRFITAKKVSTAIHHELTEAAAVMNRKQARRSSSDAMDREAKRQTVEHGTSGKEHLTIKQQLRKSLLQDELIRNSVRVF